MTERMGANGLPIKKKVETIDEIKVDESKEMIQEILEENPNATSLCDTCGEGPCVCDEEEE
jgi:hypothetical protein